MSIHFSLLLLAATLGASSIGGELPALAAENTTSYSFIEYSYLAHVRYPATDGGNYGQERVGFGTNWQQDLMPNLSSNEASYSRWVIEAPSAGAYQAVIHYASGDYAMNVYTNSQDNVQSLTLPSNNWAGGSSQITLNLEEGKNVVVFQVNQWGRVETLDLPNELNVSFPSSIEEGTYQQEDMLFQATHLSDFSLLFDAEADISYGGLPYDTSADYEGAAILFLTPASSTHSLDVDLTVLSGSNATLRVEIGGIEAGFNVDLSSYPVGEKVTVHLPSYQLDRIGFLAEEENYMRLSGDTSGASIQIHEVRESSEVDEDPASGLKVISAEELKNLVTIHGRSLEITGEIPTDWSGSGISFVHHGSGDILLNASVLGNNQNSRYAVEVDGEFSHYVSLSSSMTLFTDLPEGERTISLYKTSEAAGNLASITSLLIDEEASITKPSQQEDSLKFEFLGDSITAANQISLGDENVYEGYAVLLSKAYGASFDILATSGRGLMEGYNSENGWAASQENQMKDIWKYQSYFRDSNALRENDAPDVMVVGLGSNDLGQAIMSTFGTSIDDFTREATSFAATLREAYPEAKIIFCYGSFFNRDYIEEYRSAIEGIGDENIAFVEFPQLMHGDSGHPNALNHDEMASILSKKVAEMLGRDDPYVRRYQYETYEAEDAYRQGGSVSSAEGEQFWSNGAYIGSMGYDTSNPNYPNSIDEIAEDLSNISYLRFDVNAPSSAHYEMRLGYATSTSTNIAYRIDDGEWLELNNLNTNDWCGGHGQYASVGVDLARGNHTITITSALNSGGWINYDYLQLVEENALEECTITGENGTGYQFTSLPEVVLKGDDLAFGITLEDYYSKSSITVEANGKVLSALADGSYLLENVEENIVLTVSGVELNKWTVSFYLNEGDSEAYEEMEVEVGAPISLPAIDPTKEGYIFTGWDIPFEQMPNGDIHVYATWEEVSSSLPSDSSSSSSTISSSEPSSSSDGNSSSSSEGGDAPAEGGMNVPAIVGGTIGGVVALALIAGVTIYLIKRK